MAPLELLETVYKRSAELGEKSLSAIPEWIRSFVKIGRLELSGLPDGKRPSFPLGRGWLILHSTEPLSTDQEAFMRLLALLLSSLIPGPSPQPSSGFNGVVGRNEAIVRVMEESRRVSSSRSTVLLRGESGTGKELIATAIHQMSPRAGGPFIKVNCAALPETLLESELFGHERGAFTGAAQRRKGRFETAHGGTIFLDEIGDLPPAVQVKLLWFLQERRFERLGGNETLESDVRVIAATHRNLETAIVQGLFREDLYYRLNVVEISLPPLRDRKEDIPLLVRYFLDRFNRENCKNVRLSPAIETLLNAYDWPGNIRELENCIERLVVLAPEEVVNRESLPAIIRNYLRDVSSVARLSAPSLSSEVESLERERLRQALKRSGGVQARAARLLGISARQMAYRIRKYALTDEIVTTATKM